MRREDNTETYKSPVSLLMMLTGTTAPSTAFSCLSYVTDER